MALAEIAGFVLVWLAAFSCRTTLVSIGPLLPVFMKQLHLGGFWGGTLTAIPLLIIAVVSVPSGWIADKVGHRTALAIALGLLTLACIVPSLAGPTKGSLFLNVALSGLGVGLAQPTLAKVARGVSPRNPALPTTLYANGLVTGGLGASLLAIPLLNHLGHRWPSVFLAWGILVAITGLGWLFLKTRREPREISSLPVHNLPSSSSRPPGLYPIAMGFAAQGAVFYALVTWLPEYSVHQGWPLAQASLLVALLSLGSIVGGVMSPWLLKVGRGFRRPFLGLAVVIGVAVVGLVVLPLLDYFWAWLAGASTAIVFTLGLAAPALLSNSKAVGRDSGLLLTVGYIGAVAGPLGFGALFGATASGAMFLVAALGLSVGLAALAIPANLGAPVTEPSTAINS
ncbi:CynX/NimT family MFS transporter [Sulfobacillus harzensis]|uniref:MFS transporter n=1 Tax=Sulfobacillus harzensis TaxID=2729629 RepID=A0A7Y0L5D3_9FIRM|nr:MFS transporter [Sulfobacillus harzensis]NMP22770.1 MFS transporter [Sulfobacillus harzensis]